MHLNYDLAHPRYTLSGAQRMSGRRQPAPALRLTIPQDTLDDHRLSGRKVRLLAKIPHGMDAPTAKTRFAEAVGALAAELAAAADGTARQLRVPFVFSGKGNVAYVVGLDLLIPPEMEAVLMDRRSLKRWIHLPAPWDAPVLLSAGPEFDKREVRLLGVPLLSDLSILQKVFEDSNVQATGLERLLFSATGLECADAVRMWVPEGTVLPSEIPVQNTAGLAITTIKVHQISSLPPLSGEGHTYAAAVATGATAPHGAGAVAAGDDDTQGAAQPTSVSPTPRSRAASPTSAAGATQLLPSVGSPASPPAPIGAGGTPRRQLRSSATAPAVRQSTASPTKPASHPRPALPAGGGAEPKRARGSRRGWPLQPV